MANLGLAILSGLLGGAGGFLKEGAAAGKADEELALRKAAEARGERADAETRRSNAAKEAAGVVSDPQRYDPGLPAGPIPMDLLKILMPAMAKAKAETEDRTQAQALGREFDREATPPRENVADARTDPDLSALARMIPLLNAAGRAKIVEDRYKERDPKPVSVRDVADMSGQYETVRDPAGNLLRRERVGDPKPNDPKQPSASNLIDTLTQQYHRRIDEGMHPKSSEATNLVQRINNQKMVPYQEGGGVRGPMGTMFAPTPKPPEAAERKEIGHLNALITLGDRLIAEWAANPRLKAGTLARLGEREIGLGVKSSDLIGPTQTDAQRTFMADATDLMATYRALRSGLAVTNPEAMRSMPLVPDDPGGLTPQQLSSLVGWAKRNRVEIDRSLSAAGRRTGAEPLPGSSSPSAPSAGVWQLRETATGRTRPYQPSPGETQPPAGYTRIP